MLAIGNGEKQSIINQIQSLGTNLLSVSPGWNNRNIRSNPSSSESATLDEDSIAYIEANISNIKSIAPTISNRSVVNRNDYTTNTTVNWVTLDYLTVRNLEIVDGSFFINEDIDNYAKVAVLWHNIAEDIFWSWVFATNPIWEDLQIGNLIMTVIWVLDDNTNSNDAIFVPITTAATRLFWTHNYSTILISAQNPDTIEDTKIELEEGIKSYLWLSPTDNATFTVQSQSEMIEAMSDITGIMTTFLAGIAAISLLVWGIGVMNIMLVSVTERIKEIGIRKAIWAKNKDIRLQFLTESVLMSVMWGIIWILLSFLVVFFINKFLTTAIISLNAVVLAFFSAVTIGIVFWILPANNASKLKPIEALRYE